MTACCIFFYLSQQGAYEEFCLQKQRREKRLKNAIEPLFSGTASRIANSQPRLKALKIIFTPYLHKLKDALTKGNLSDFKNCDPPLKEVTGIIIANRGRPVMELGMDTSPFLPPDWQSPFFFGLMHGSPILEKRIGYFYPRPVSAEVFNAFAEELQVMKNSCGIFAWTFMKHKNKALLILINLDRLSSEKLAEMLQLHFAGLYKDNKAPKIPWGILVSFSLILALTGSLLNWIELAGRYFSFRLGLLLIVVFLTIQFFTFNFFTALAETRKKLLLEEERENITRILKGWEQDFEPATDRLAGKLLHNFRQNNNLQTREWPEQINIARSSLNGFLQLHPEEMEPAIETFFAFVIPNALLNHPRCPPLNPQELTERFETPRFAELRKLLFDKKSKNSEFKGLLLDSARFMPVRMGQKEFLWLFTIPDNQNKMLENFAIIYPREAFVENHIREMSEKQLKLNPGLAVAIKNDKIYGDTQRLNRHPDLMDWAFDNEGVAGIGHEENGLVIGLSLNSALYKSRFFFLIPAIHLTQNLNQIRQHRNICLLLILLISPVVWFFLARRLLQPVKKLEKGFAAVMQDDFSFRLPESGQDESSSLLQSFNSMNSSLAEKRKLAPFVALQLLRLFIRKDGGIEPIIECRAAVVFSDIRSFTTISENYQPEEIVGMLNDYFTIWQKTVEKNGGIIEKFIGDAVVCIFPESLSTEYNQSAVRTASSVMQSLIDFNATRQKQGLFTIQNGIGITSGHISTGIIGNETKKHFFADGHSVEFAEELEAESKNAVYTKILVDENIVTHCGDMANFQPHKSSSPKFAGVYELAEFLKDE
jgi:adenylate cyclase